MQEDQVVEEEVVNEEEGEVSKQSVFPL